MWNVHLTPPNIWGLHSVQSAPHSWHCIRDDVYPVCSGPLIPERWSLPVCSQPLLRIRFSQCTMSPPPPLPLRDKVYLLYLPVGPSSLPRDKVGKQVLVWIGPSYPLSVEVYLVCIGPSSLLRDEVYLVCSGPLIPDSAWEMKFTQSATSPPYSPYFSLRWSSPVCSQPLIPPKR